MTDKQIRRLVEGIADRLPEDYVVVRTQQSLHISLDNQTVGNITILNPKDASVMGKFPVQIGVVDITGDLLFQIAEAIENTLNGW